MIFIKSELYSRKSVFIHHDHEHDHDHPVTFTSTKLEDLGTSVTKRPNKPYTLYRSDCEAFLGEAFTFPKCLSVLNLGKMRDGEAMEWRWSRDKNEIFAE